MSIRNKLRMCGMNKAQAYIVCRDIHHCNYGNPMQWTFSDNLTVECAYGWITVRLTLTLNGHTVTQRGMIPVSPK